MISRSKGEAPALSVSDAIAIINQTLEYAYPTIIVEGEVSSFKVSQGKYVFFDLRDDNGALGCFMMVYSLRIPLEDGMRVRVVAYPKLTQWGKFSLTVREVMPVGEGSLKRAFELLYAKLEKAGLFDEARKRPLPLRPKRIGVISSTQAAGYADFIKILNARWGGVDIVVAHTAVQGASAPPQIVRALEYLNGMGEPPEVIAIIRGGGSLDDLSAFNDEPLVRAIAASRVPVITGIGHEVDTSLADMAADVRAATPSNAAQLLVPDRQDFITHLYRDVNDMEVAAQAEVYRQRELTGDRLSMMVQTLQAAHRSHSDRHSDRELYFRQLNPMDVLRRGYSVLRDTAGRVIEMAVPGDAVTIETKSHMIYAGVTNVSKK